MLKGLSLSRKELVLLFVGLILLMVSILGLKFYKFDISQFFAAEPNIVPQEFSYGADPLQKLDLYRGDSADPKNTILMVHGGGWSAGMKRPDTLVMQHLRSLALQNGYAVVAMNYRLAPTDRFPISSGDVGTVIEWIAQNKNTYNLTGNVIIIGESAGAHLGALAVMSQSNSNIRGFIGFSGPYDLVAYGDKGALSETLYKYFGCRYDQCPQTWQNASPVLKPSSAVPMLLVAGDRDGTVQFTQSQSLATRNGNSTRVYIVNGGEHTGPTMISSAIDAQVLQFLNSIFSPTSLVNNASFVSQSVAQNMIAGRTYNVSVTFKNTGTKTWDKRGVAGDYGYAYRIKARNPTDNIIWGLFFVPIPFEPVNPGETATFTFSVKAPARPGTYNFQWQMNQGLVGWFGVPSENKIVTVTQ